MEIVDYDFLCIFTIFFVEIIINFECHGRYSYTNEITRKTSGSKQDKKLTEHNKEQTGKNKKKTSKIFLL